MRYFRLKRNQEVPTKARTGEIVLYSDSDGALQTVDIDENVSPIGNGGSQPVQALYTADAAVTIANNATSQLPFDSRYSGTELLDRTNPSACSFLAAGTYAITACVSNDAFTAGGGAILTIDIGNLLEVPDYKTGEQHALTVIAKATANDVLGVKITNKDGAASRDFLLGPVAVVKLA